MDLLLLEADSDLGRTVADRLGAAGHRVHWCRDVADAQELPAPALALLDLQLPVGDGLDLLRRWRAEGLQGPVILLTAPDQVGERIRGLQAGADDALVKPVDLDELLARIDAVVRRSAQATPVPGADALRIDQAGCQVWRKGTRIALTQMEWSVLACLARRPGRIFSRGEIEDQLHVLGLAGASSNSLEVIVSRLRKKLGAGTISTHRGRGYRLDG